MTKFNDKTRGGLEYRIYATDGVGPDSMHGAVKYAQAQTWTKISWSPDGTAENGVSKQCDLIPLREPSEAAVEAAWDEWVASRPFDPCAWKAGKRAFRKAMASAYEIDFPEGGA